MSSIKPLIAIIFYLLCACTDRQGKEEQVIVFCASSLTPVVEQMKVQWEKDHTEKIIVSSASSGTLARQIENGARADIFLSASNEWMAYLVEKMELDNGPKKIATNQLVVVASSETRIQFNKIDELFALISGKEHMFAIGDPAHVPLGKYTKEVIEHHCPLQEIGRNLVLTKDARSALRLVELEEVDFGIVYRSDAEASTSTSIAFSIPEKYHSSISYQAVLLTKDDGSAMKFLNYLSLEENKVFWTKNGFFE